MEIILSIYNKLTIGELLALAILSYALLAFQVMAWMTVIGLILKNSLSWGPQPPPKGNRRLYVSHREDNVVYLRRIEQDPETKEKPEAS